ncbi:MAG: prepilin-type N-terminal cleavage/methylation domain-containing protein [Tepidisphaeraceae bacterium]
MSFATARSRRPGFTLVELLVVIGIIALLISILLPALSRAQEQARSVQCLSTCRMMAQAAVIHANDHLGYFPIAGLEWNLTGGVCNPTGLDDAGQRKYTYYTDGSVTRPVPMTVALALSLKIKVRTTDLASMQADMLAPGYLRLFQCASQVNVPRGLTQQGSDGWTAPGEYLSYIFNEAFLGRREADKDATTGGTPKAKSTRVHAAGSVFLFGDGLPRGLADMGWLTVPDTGLNLMDATMLDYYNYYQPTYQNFDLKRHGGRMNIICVDGHAETIYLPGKLKDFGLTRGIYD